MFCFSMFIEKRVHFFYKIWLLISLQKWEQSKYSLKAWFLIFAPLLTLLWKCKCVFVAPCMFWYLCFVPVGFVFFSSLCLLALQSSRWGRESRLHYFNCCFVLLCDHLFPALVSLLCVLCSVVCNCVFPALTKYFYCWYKFRYTNYLSVKL